jgi:hypothetical protein
VIVIFVPNWVVAPVEFAQAAINIVAKLKLELEKGRGYERQCTPLRLYAHTPIRPYAYKALFEAKRLVTRADTMEVAEVSLATFKRDIAKRRDQMGMPILFDEDRGGYYLDRNNLATEMPGLSVSPEELVSLLTIQRLIEQLEPGLVGLKLRPLQKKRTELLKAKGLGEAEIARRVRMTSAGKREMEIKAFEQVALATISRQQIKVTHLNRQRAERVEHTIFFCGASWWSRHFLWNSRCQMQKSKRPLLSPAGLMSKRKARFADADQQLVVELVHSIDDALVFSTSKSYNVGSFVLTE